MRSTSLHDSSVSDGGKDYRILVLLVAGIAIWLNCFWVQHVPSHQPTVNNTRLVEFSSPTTISQEMLPLYFLPFDINRADALLLQTIPGIGPQLSLRIISLRTARNGFKSLDELLDVEGIGHTKYSHIIEHCNLVL